MTYHSMPIGGKGLPGLADPRLESFSGYQKCIQCGRCSASCPASFIYDDFTPRDVMRRMAVGDVDALVTGEEIWRCGQCYSCAARCPRDNSAATAILALRTPALTKNPGIDHIRHMEAHVKKNLYDTGETILPATLSLPLEEFGERTVRRCSGNGEKRLRLGYPSDNARPVPIPEDALAEIRCLLKETGFLWGSD